MATELTIDRAHQALPYLVQCAEHRETITYGELARRIGLPHHRPINLPLYYIRDEICIPRELPLLTAIVVRKDTGLPGGSWLPEGTGHLSEEEYRREYEKYRALVFNCEKWDDLLEELGLPPV
jgi:hypothetical protein